MSNVDDEMSSSDRLLMQALADAIGGPRPPIDLVARCEGLLAWIDVDSELAMLLDQPVVETAGTRGATLSPTVLEFVVGDGSCVIEITLSEGGIRGQLLGGEASAAVARLTTGEGISAPIDGLGVFEITEVPSRSIRLELELIDGRRIHTDWFVI